MKSTERISLGLVLIALGMMLAVNAWLRPKAAPAAAGLVLARRDGYAMYAGEAPPAGRPQTFGINQLYQGLLLYVGEKDPLPQPMPAQQARDVRSMVGLYIPAAEHVSLSEETIYALCRLVEENPLVQTWIMTGMRSPAEQTALQTKAFTEYQATMSVEQALRRAAADIPDSGKSEHQLATAFDVRLEGPQDWSKTDAMARTADGRWLLENAWRYGFIRRYPPEKAQITGVGNESAHWRYVGSAHAACMHTADWCLEEYLQALHDYGTLRLVFPEGESLWVLCAPIQENSISFAIPEHWTAAVSADNMGYAVCVLSKGDED